MKATRIVPMVQEASNPCWSLSLLSWLSWKENAGAPGKSFLTLEVPIFSTSNSVYLYLLVSQLTDSNSFILPICLVHEDFSLELFLQKEGRPMVGWKEWQKKQALGTMPPCWPGVLTRTGISFSSELSGTFQGPSLFSSCPCHLTKWRVGLLVLHGNCSYLDFGQKELWPNPIHNPAHSQIYVISYRDIWK